MVGLSRRRTTSTCRRARSSSSTRSEMRRGRSSQRRGRANDHPRAGSDGRVCRHPRWLRGLRVAERGPGTHHRRAPRASGGRRCRHARDARVRHRAVVSGASGIGRERRPRRPRPVDREARSRTRDIGLGRRPRRADRGRGERAHSIRGARGHPSEDGDGSLMDLSIDGWRDWGRAAARETARRRLIDFVAIAHRDYQAGWVHRDLCERLERFSSAAAAGLSPRLVVAMPPRHGKTRLVSQIWPIWHLARHPGHEFVAASYGQELADDNSRTAREVARSDRVLGVFPGLLPQRPGRRPSAYRSGDVDRVNHWRVGGGGSYQAVGVGGPLTGRGAHIIGIDDPLKDRAEADSPARRRLVCGWYRSTAYTRLAPGGGVIITATRWHENDLTGQVLAEMAEDGDAWEVVSYPAIAEEDEPHRRIGEALHPERYPIDNLLAIQRAIGSREWAALYQQRPAPVAGGLFRREWFGRTYSFEPRTAPFDEQAISVDATFKGTDTADFVCMQVWGRRGAQFYLLDQIG